MRASADCLQIAASSASPWKKLPACALEFTGRVEIWTPTRYLEDTRFGLDEPTCSWVGTMANHTGFSPPDDPPGERSRSSPEEVPSRRGRGTSSTATTHAMSVVTRLRGSSLAAPPVTRPRTTTTMESSPSTPEQRPATRRRRSGSGRALEGIREPSNEQVPIQWIDPQTGRPIHRTPSPPNRSRYTTYRDSTSDMPAAAFVAGAAIQNAHNASLIAQQAATVAEQQTLEANQARHYASFVEAQATQALQQAEATLLETRAKAEAYVAQAEANVRNTRQQAQAFAASVDQEREQFQAQLNSKAQQWARGVEADARHRVQQLQHQTEQYMSAQQDTVRNLQQQNAVLEQQLLAERSPVPNSPKSPMTQILTASQTSTPIMAYGKDPSEGNPFAGGMHLEFPPGLVQQDAQASLPLTPKDPLRPQEYYIGSVQGTPQGSVVLAGGHAGQVASLEAQVSSLQDTVKLLAGHLQSLLNAPKTMTPIVMGPGPTVGVPVPPPPPPPT